MRPSYCEEFIRFYIKYILIIINDNISIGHIRYYRYDIGMPTSKERAALQALTSLVSYYWYFVVSILPSNRLPHLFIIIQQKTY